jgi:nitrogen fixation protein FixH
MSATTRHRGELRAIHVLAMLLAFFGAVIAVDVGFSILAVQSFPGEDEPNSYAQGLRFNATLASERAQRALGWTAGAALRAMAGGAGVDLRIHDRNGAPLSGLTIEATLRRPTDQRLDRPLAFQDLGGGRYRALIGALQAGQWRLRARARDTSAREIDFDRNFAWPAN